MEVGNISLRQQYAFGPSSVTSLLRQRNGFGSKTDEATRAFGVLTAEGFQVVHKITSQVQVHGKGGQRLESS
jgi:hypothetical protein